MQTIMDFIICLVGSYDGHQIFLYLGNQTEEPTNDKMSHWPKSASTPDREVCGDCGDWL